MLGIEIVTWIIVGLVLGGAAHYISTRKPAWGEVLIVGAIGALVGGLIFRSGGTPGTFSGVALVTAGVGAIVFLVIDGLFHGKRPPQQHPQT
jgi:uncharacterized membrane protein YeaQ/YmgE (transglycosylase-associated protein family)